MTFQPNSFNITETDGQKNLVAELSDLNLRFMPSQVWIAFPEATEVFNFERADRDASGEDTYGWHYVGNFGSKLLLIND